MANKKISELTEASSINTTDVLALVQSGETKKVTIDTLLETIYPVGTIIIKDSSTDYSSWLGFTWTKVFDGKVLVGQDTTDTDFDVIGETGGEKTHTLTVNEMPSHNHVMQQVTSDFKRAGTDGEYVIASTTGTAYSTQSKGGGAAHNNMPPYQVVAYWKRTA